MAAEKLAKTKCRAICADILHFPARVLVTQAAMSWNTQRLCSQPPERGFCRTTDAASDSLFCGLRPWMYRAGWFGRTVGQYSVVMRLRLKGISRTSPIGWLQHVPGARRAHVTASLWARHPPCRSTSRHVSVRETPNAEARNCVARRRTPPVDAPR